MYRKWILLYALENVAVRRTGELAQGTSEVANVALILYRPTIKNVINESYIDYIKTELSILGQNKDKNAAVKWETQDQ